MPPFGEKTRLPAHIERAPFTDEERLQQLNVDITIVGVCRRMRELSPVPRTRHWYSVNGLVSVGPKATYIPKDTTNIEMTTWLETVHWRKGYGPTGSISYGESRYDTGPHEVAVNLYTQAKGISGAFAGVKGHAQIRAWLLGEEVYFPGLLGGGQVRGVSVAPYLLEDLGSTLDLIEDARFRTLGAQFLSALPPESNRPSSV